MKKIIATGGMLAYILWFNSTGAFAATMPEITATDTVGRTPLHTRTHKQSRFEQLAQKYNIDSTALRTDLANKVPHKTILKSYDITKNQLREIATAFTRSQ